MAPTSGFGRAVGNARSFVGNALGGLRGWSNLASWTVAGTLAYYLWVKPARELQKEQEVSTYPSLRAPSLPLRRFGLVGSVWNLLPSDHERPLSSVDRSSRACSF